MKNSIAAIACFLILVLQSCIRDNEDPVAVAPYEGIVMELDSVGGASEPNQVWIRLENSEYTHNRRTDWDLGFYSGTEFKVILNNSTYMAAAKIENVADINSVNSTNTAELKEKVQVANFDPENASYVDDVKGNFPTAYTAIAGINATDSENAVYLVNMGKEIYTDPIPNGSVITGGASRGWKKLQITRSGNSYKIKYADLDATTYTEKIIEKNPAYNFTYFSMVKNNTVTVQPEKKKWDLCFTVFTNLIPGAGSYVYSDFVTTNIMGGAAAYQVTAPAGASAAELYNSFTAAQIDQSKFVTNDQRTIGGSWRLVGPNGSTLYGDRFYIVKDTEGHYYKLRFNKLSSIHGERGRPQFEYKPL